MVQPSKYEILDFEWDEHNLSEIYDHRVEYFEAEECFFNHHQVFRNKRKPGRGYETFKLEGITDRGRKLLLIFYLKDKTSAKRSGRSYGLIRVITSWEI